MDSLRIATVQFENRSGDKTYNLDTIRAFASRASLVGCQVVSFHETSITGYTFVRNLGESQLQSLAEQVPAGPSTQRLIQIAKDCNITILAGLFEKDGDEKTGECKVYNTYICVSPTDGFLAKHRKLHPFINPHLSPGETYTTFTMPGGWKCGILICYDNNIVENVRATALLGAEIIFMPHVTMCTPSSRPGAGFVDPVLWMHRNHDPTTIRAEFRGLKGREWLMKWLPARAYDNGVYVVFSNPIGMDGDQLKNGCSMILDPFGDVLAECYQLEDAMVSALCTRDKLELAGGHRYRRARKPDLYRAIIGAGNDGEQVVAWLPGK